MVDEQSRHERLDEVDFRGRSAGSVGWDEVGKLFFIR